MKNQYFDQSELKSIIHMGENNEKVIRIEGTEIEWNAGCNPTVEKKTKRKKGKKGQNKQGEKKVASFFDFFMSLDSEVEGKNAKDMEKIEE